MASAAQPAHEIPEKSLFRIGEVSRLTETKTFVLRFWESEFPTLQPVKSPAGHRLYRREDIETVFEIKRLLYEQGFTIAGARKHLAEKQGTTAESAAEAGIAIANESAEENLQARSAVARPAPVNNASRETLVNLREELLAVLTLLKAE
jgi:DNA-binding transcriptional MerR regulator